MLSDLSNIFRLGVKELWSLRRDSVMLVLIVYVFTIGIYTAATAIPETLYHAPIAIVDEDGSPLSARIVSGFFLPKFNSPKLISLADMDRGMDNGDYTFRPVSKRTFWPIERPLPSSMSMPPG
jgi:ABC-2 type transport system permease protein